MVASAGWHRKALQISSMLTESFYQMRREPAAMARPNKVIRVLNHAGVRFVVMGTHGIVGYRSQPRATQDVDVLVAKRDHRKAVAAIQEAYPRLEVRDTPVVTRFVHPKTKLVVIDLMKPNFPLFQMTFRQCVKIAETYFIPDLEMALASKFAAMVSPNREQSKKLVDAGDFVDVVVHNRADIDLLKLKRFGDKVYPDGGAEIMQLIDDIDAGRPIRL
jgi:hypothetical protein